VFRVLEHPKRKEGYQVADCNPEFLFGDKRKAEAAECVDTSDDKDEEGAEDAEAHKAAAFADDFWNKDF